MRNRRMQNRFAVLVLVACLSLGVVPVGAQEQNGMIQWSEPVQLTDPEGRAWFPEIDADPAGTTRVIWEENLPAEEVDEDKEQSEEEAVNAKAVSAAIMLTNSSDDGWATPNDIYVKDAYNAGRPIIQSDTGYLHMLGRSFRGEGDSAQTMMRLGAVYYTRAALVTDPSNAQSWSMPVALSRSSAYWASMVASDDETLIVAYNEVVNFSEETGFELQPVLMTRRSVDQGATWEDPIRVSSPGVPATRSSLVVVDQRDSVVLCWDEGYDNLSAKAGPPAIYTAVSTDGGASWQHVASISDHDDEDDDESYAATNDVEQCTLATDGDTTLLVYRAQSDDVLLYRTSDDGGITWSTERVIPDAVARPYNTPHHFDKLGTAVDSDGRILLSYVGTDPKSPTGHAVMLTTFLEGEWSEPQTVAVHDGFPEYPRLAVSRGNHVTMTYFVREELFDEQAPVSVWVVDGKTPASQTAAGAIDASVPSVSRPSPAVPTGAPSATNVQIFEAQPIPPAPAPVSISGDLVIEPRSTLSRPIYEAIGVTSVVLLVCAAMLVMVRHLRQIRI